MVSDQEKLRSNSNCNCIDGDKNDINDINYDNMKLTATSIMSSSSSSTTTTSSTSTTLKNAEVDHDTERFEKLSTYYHSTTSTPTSSAIIQESIMNITTAGCDLGHASAETLPRPSRAYRLDL
ncbi:unnamed protein product [Wuchereria bancrofti]|uniref:Uncharacterized protein n=1 Tax=Wuchereria bancrofti TaxID=6293 RepID=A0A3P7G083_WUCBA|nr:unnamed protein product [Wuchereria bancrofti]